ncbi:tRNA (adenosine(37)-N6)-threonylcarbamoyltransferase complex dimerization subunit type 1 TsaB [Flavobacterium sp. NKUCC04_CG]|uniref:tRNA (adenosine(37)-N6)-threonylcarbamoyltransferase complex dimerization subunit type 1 TsaB n=1 Tax=Flavobacterium sp. NKUCC04_CG TaxID=2842121 RepID=UPI001C5B09DC|nr:tRNA (adenosine(37)-N6)-threonylcarbamoyltransferase complex dimerization subunit type 1 TsaB [Flavobacterium sp. NKUCC04_CG]MBW3518217.1 tRNA (adenosine(37)-N6)-threonylcarbamoyltransferase complex dimerization subunit type 1 TsaB [Flavobacterium sp. NKUCC04_CG]
MVYILSVETATKNCSVSLSGNGELLYYEELAEAQFSHAEKLHLYIESVLKQAGLNCSDLSAIAVSKGPGSYTGLRIGVSAVKGLCYALGLPLIGLNTLNVLARQLKDADGLIVPMIDARRMEVFTAVFNQKYERVEETKALIITPTALDYLQPQKIHLIGDGAAKCKDVLQGGMFVYHDGITYPSAKDMGGLAYGKYLNHDFEDVAYFEPFYLKDFLLLTKKQ